MRRALAALALALLAGLACAGCGFGLAHRAGEVRLQVTGDFGARRFGRLSLSRLPSGETDLSLLRRLYPKVATAAVPLGSTNSGVTAVDGHRASSSRRWVLFVNGVHADRVASAMKVHAGDQVWFDLHDTAAAPLISAVVGAFPEPFTNGINGQRYPTTIECSKGFRSGCATVTRELRRLGVVASPGAPGYGSGPDTLSINIGTWHDIYGEVAAQLIRYGPGPSGVYARILRGGRELALENAAGQTVRTLGSGWGLIAATANSNDPAPTWFITGSGAGAVRSAVRALTPRTLAGHFALAVHGGRRYPLPLPGGAS
jgi:hypothetical protein